MFDPKSCHAIAMHAPSAASELALYTLGIEYIEQLCMLSQNNLHEIPSLAVEDIPDLIALAGEFGGLSVVGIDLSELSVTETDKTIAGQKIDLEDAVVRSSGPPDPCKSNAYRHKVHTAIEKYEAIVRSGMLDDYSESMVATRAGLSN